MSEMDETIREFLVEAQENMEQAYKALESLEANSEDLEPIRGLFRCIHSIKGASGFFNFTTLEGVGHFCEDILSKLRDGKIGLNPDRQALLYEAADAIDKILSSLVESGSEGEEDYIDLIMRLRDDSQNESDAGAASPPAGAPAAKEAGPAPGEADAAAPGDSPAEEAGPTEADEAPEEDVQAKETEGEIDLAAVSEQMEELLEQAPAEEQAASPAREAAGAPAPAPAAKASKAPAAETATAHASVAETSIRVDVSLLERLMNLVEELVLSRNQILRHTTGVDNIDLANASQTLNLVTGELQEGIMKTRMQPVSTVFNKFPRIVRDVARSCQKEVHFKVEGEETELDRTIIEAIKDPLTHIVRNSVDHGIEVPAERTAAGKPEGGTLLIRAFHEGGQVVLEIIDDGAGINVERVREKAIERGVITPARAAEMTPPEIQNLIFLPGFSTVEVVSNLSGRGVGMDVVKTNIEKIGGVIDLISEEGQGTTLRISIPLTLAIVPALIVSTGGERFAIPQVNLRELVRLEAEDVASQIEHVAGAETYRLRGSLLPLVRLSEVLRLETGGGPEEERDESGGGAHGGLARGLNILVLVSGNVQYGLIVDQVHDIEEVVVKPLSKHASSVKAFAGATILGDGKVVLILDASGVAEEASLRLDLDSGRSKAEEEAALASQEMQSLLLFNVSSNEQFAIPLALVSRLEKFAASDLNCAAGREVIQYRGRILPLMRLEGQLPISPPGEAGEEINVIVFNFEGNEVGVVVNEIVDVAETAVSLDNTTFEQAGVLGSGIINDQTTLFLDIFSIVEREFPKWFETKATPLSRSETGGVAPAQTTILLVEDSQFFRTVVRSYFESQGFNVMDAEDGVRALEVLEDASEVDIVVTDIEMPNMNGFELAERLRASERWGGIPIMALTSLSSEEDRERGLKAGVDEYCVKLQRAEVLETIHKLLSAKPVS